MNAERLAEIRERDAEYTDELLDGWRKLFERHAMKCDRAIVDRHDLLAEVDRLTRELAEAQAERDELAVTALMAMNDAHPVYSNTTGWRGGIGGQAVTSGCSHINPPPGDEYWEIGFPQELARRVVADNGINYAQVASQLRERWQEAIRAALSGGAS